MPPESNVYRRGLHIAAVATACAVFPLVFVGAGVTSKDAGMAFPDGFTANGYFLRNPPGWWDQEDTRWEHGHRLLGRAVGVLAIVVAVWAWRRGGLVRGLALANLGAIVVQGVLGAFRVNEVSTILAMMHGVLGQLCFALASTVALVTSSLWIARPNSEASPAAGFSRKLSLIVAGSIFIQLVLGAALRHFGADASLAAHLLWVIAVAFAVGWATLWFMAQHPQQTLLVRLAQALGALLALQLVLGAFAFVATTMNVYAGSFVFWAAPSAHVAVGALLFAGSVLLAVASYWMLGPLASRESQAPRARLASA